MTESEETTANSAADTTSHASSSLWNDNHRRLYEHLNARRAEALATSSADYVDNSEDQATLTTSNSKDGTPKQTNIFETLLGRIHKSLQQLHDQNQQTNQSQSGVEDAPTTTSSTSPSALSAPPKTPRSPGSSVVPTTTDFTKPCRKNRTRITKRRYPSPVPVRGTKAERLRECLKSFPKRHSPCSIGQCSSSQNSSPNLESRSVTPEVLLESEDDLEDQ